MSSVPIVRLTERLLLKWRYIGTDERQPSPIYPKEAPIVHIRLHIALYLVYLRAKSLESNKRYIKFPSHNSTYRTRTNIELLKSLRQSQ